MLIALTHPQSVIADLPRESLGSIEEQRNLSAQYQLDEILNLNRTDASKVSQDLERYLNQVLQIKVDEERLGLYRGTEVLLDSEVVRLDRMGELAVKLAKFEASARKSATPSDPKVLQIRRAAHQLRYKLETQMASQWKQYVGRIAQDSVSAESYEKILGDQEKNLLPLKYTWFNYYLSQLSSTKMRDTIGYAKPTALSSSEGLEKAIQQRVFGAQATSVQNLEDPYYQSFLNLLSHDLSNQDVLQSEELKTETKLLRAMDEMEALENSGEVRSWGRGGIIEHPRYFDHRISANERNSRLPQNNAIIDFANSNPDDPVAGEILVRGFDDLLDEWADLQSLIDMGGPKKEKYQKEQEKVAALLLGYKENKGVLGAMKSHGALPLSLLQQSLQKRLKKINSDDLPRILYQIRNKKPVTTCKGSRNDCSQAIAALQFANELGVIPQNGKFDWSADLESLIWNKFRCGKKKLEDHDQYVPIAGAAGCFTVEGQGYGSASDISEHLKNPELSVDTAGGSFDQLASVSQDANEVLAELRTSREQRMIHKARRDIDDSLKKLSSERKQLQDQINLLSRESKEINENRSRAPSSKIQENNLEIQKLKDKIKKSNEETHAIEGMLKNPDFNEIALYHVGLKDFAIEKSQLEMTRLLSLMPPSDWPSELSLTGDHCSNSMDDSVDKQDQAMRAARLFSSEEKFSTYRDKKKKEYVIDSLVSAMKLNMIDQITDQPEDLRNASMGRRISLALTGGSQVYNKLPSWYYEELARHPELYVTGSGNSNRPERRSSGAQEQSAQFAYHDIYDLFYSESNAKLNDGWNYTDYTRFIMSGEPTRFTNGDSQSKNPHPFFTTLSGDDRKVGVNKSAVKRFLENHPDIYQKLEQAIQAKMKDKASEYQDSLRDLCQAQVFDFSENASPLSGNRLRENRSLVDQFFISDPKHGKYVSQECHLRENYSLWGATKAWVKGGGKMLVHMGLWAAAPFTLGATAAVSIGWSMSEALEGVHNAEARLGLMEELQKAGLMSAKDVDQAKAMIHTADRGVAVTAAFEAGGLAVPMAHLGRRLLSARPGEIVNLTRGSNPIQLTRSASGLEFTEQSLKRLRKSPRFREMIAKRLNAEVTDQAMRRRLLSQLGETPEAVRANIHYGGADDPILKAAKDSGKAFDTEAGAFDYGLSISRLRRGEITVLNPKHLDEAMLPYRPQIQARYNEAPKLLDTLDDYLTKRAISPEDVTLHDVYFHSGHGGTNGHARYATIKVNGVDRPVVAKAVTPIFDGHNIDDNLLRELRAADFITQLGTGYQFHGVTKGPDGRIYMLIDLMPGESLSSAKSLMNANTFKDFESLLDRFGKAGLTSFEDNLQYHIQTNGKIAIVDAGASHPSPGDSYGNILPDATLNAPSGHFTRERLSLMVSMDDQTAAEYLKYLRQDASKWNGIKRKILENASTDERFIKLKQVVDELDQRISLSEIERRAALSAADRFTEVNSGFRQAGLPEIVVQSESEQAKLAIQKAHELGVPGPDGKFMEVDLIRKYRILRQEGGLTPDQARWVMQQHYSGVPRGSSPSPTPADLSPEVFARVKGSQVLPKLEGRKIRLSQAYKEYDNVHEIKMLSPLERQRFRIYQHEGRFYDSQGKLLCRGAECEGIFVMDEAGRIYYSPRAIQDETIHHSSLVGGKDKTVRAAGVMQFQDGKLISFSNASGHYQPDPATNLQLLDDLVQRGSALPERLEFVLPHRAGALEYKFDVRELVRRGPPIAKSKQASAISADDTLGRADLAKEKKRFIEIEELYMAKEGIEATDKALQSAWRKHLKLILDAEAKAYNKLKSLKLLETPQAAGSAPQISSAFVVSGHGNALPSDLSPELLQELRRTQKFLSKTHSRRVELLPDFRDMDEALEIKYFKPAERAQFQVFQKDGYLFDAQGKLLCRNGECFGIYTMDETGRIYFFPNNEIAARVKHSSLTSGKGKSISSAGDITVKDGKIIQFNNNSGHYQPDAEINLQLLDEVVSKGSKLPESIEFLTTVTENGINSHVINLRELARRGPPINESKVSSALSADDTLGRADLAERKNEFIDLERLNLEMTGVDVTDEVLEEAWKAEVRMILNAERATYQKLEKLGLLEQLGKKPTRKPVRKPSSTGLIENFRDLSRRFVSDESGRVVIKDLPMASSFALSKDFKKVIQASPAVKSLREKYGLGEGLVFEVTPRPRANLGEVHLDGGAGEQIQSQMMYQVLQEVFPQARFAGLNGVKSPRLDGVSFPTTGPNKVKHVVLSIADSAEVNLPRMAGTIEMSRLKSINPGIEIIEKNAMRKPMGIRDDQVVASFYIQSPSGSIGAPDAPSFTELLRVLSVRKRPDIVFMSSGGSRYVDTSLFQRQLGDSYHVVRLSEFHGSQVKPGVTTVVINDTLGKVPYLYNVSDVAVVQGPINIFEPLTAKTPTVFFNGSDVLEHYNPQVFNHMARQAKLTGGAFEVSSIDEFTEAIARAFELNPEKIVPPYAVRFSDGGKTNLEAFLEEISRNINSTR